MHSLTLDSPAKLNLTLYVVGKYPNDYHKLITLFHRISLRDTLRLKKKKTPDIHLTCSNSQLACDESNLIIRAYRLLQKKFPKLGGVSVHLTKRIPMGGGLGGGSSNAAFFLLGMKKLYNLPLSKQGAVNLGKQLGADVPFFIYEANQALGKGRGDEIISKPSRGKKWFVLVLSPKGLDTRKVYQALSQNLSQASLTKGSHATKMTCDFLKRQDFRRAKGFLYNELEQAAFRLRPSIQKIIAKIIQLGIPAVAMSGSGPSVFAVCPSERDARHLARQLKRNLSSEKVVVCHTF